MTTNDKTRTTGRRARPGTVAHGFRHDINPARSAFLSRRFSRESSDSGFAIRFERHGRFLAAARRASPLAFPSQKAPKNAQNDSTHSDERNPSQSAENNQRGYAPLDTLVSARAEQNRERKMKGRPHPTSYLPRKMRSCGGAGGACYTFRPVPSGRAFVPPKERRGWRTLRVAVPGRWVYRRTWWS
jgi:hypothetical protein